VHLEATYGVHQIRQVSFAPISYCFSRNASFDERNISSEPILIKLKIDGLFKVLLPSKLAGREKPILSPIDSILQALSKENVLKTEPNAENVPKWLLTGPAGLFAVTIASGSYYILPIWRLHTLSGL
jgi:hypothetical protein